MHKQCPFYLVGFANDNRDSQDCFRFLFTKNRVIIINQLGVTHELVICRNLARGRDPNAVDGYSITCKEFGNNHGVRFRLKKETTPEGKDKVTGTYTTGLNPHDCGSSGELQVELVEAFYDNLVLFLAQVNKEQ